MDRESRKDLAQAAFAVCCLGAVVAFSLLVDSGNSRHVSRQKAVQAPPTEEEIYTGSILFMPYDGNDCRQNLLDNLTGNIRENGIVACDAALSQMENIQSRTMSSARWAASGSTNRGPPLRGEVAASSTGTTIAADSGSRRPWKRVEPSSCLLNFRYRLSRRAFSRAAMPARSSWSRAQAASAARLSRVVCGAAAVRARAAVVRSSSVAVPAAARRVRMISAAPT